MANKLVRSSVRKIKELDRWRRHPPCSALILARRWVWGDSYQHSVPQLAQQFAVFPFRLSGRVRDKTPPTNVTVVILWVLNANTCSLNIRARWIYMTMCGNFSSRSIKTSAEREKMNANKPTRSQLPYRHYHFFTDRSWFGPGRAHNSSQWTPS